jgi:hypothetical protein
MPHLDPWRDQSGRQLHQAELTIFVPNHFGHQGTYHDAFEIDA